MTILLPAAHLHVGSSAPACYIFNATDELMQRTVSTLGASTTIFTASMWVKKSEDEEGFLLSLVTDDVTATQALVTGNRQLWLRRLTGGSFAWDEFTAVDQFLNDNAWHHYVFRYDSTQGTTDNRIRIYRDGTLLADTDGPGGAPSASESHAFFSNGSRHEIGNHNVSGGFHNKRMAYIDVLEGVSAAPTDFAFDDSGTWTRIPYAGSYGTYGFSLDGTDGFNDVSGNNQNFTGVNMTVADNLDDADLPPST